MNCKKTFILTGSCEKINFLKSFCRIYSNLKNQIYPKIWYKVISCKFVLAAWTLNNAVVKDIKNYL